MDAIIRTSLLSVVGFFLCFVSVASESNPLVIRVERRQEDFLEQSAIVLTSSHIKLTRNSNFVCGPQSEVFLGMLGRKANRSEESDYNYFGEIESRTPKPSSPPSERNRAFLWKTYLGDIDVSPIETINARLIHSVKEFCDWVPSPDSSVDGTTILLSPDGDSLLMKSRPSGEVVTMKVTDAKCISDNTLQRKPYLRCVVPKVGIAYLERPQSAK